MKRPVLISLVIAAVIAAVAAVTLSYYKNAIVKSAVEQIARNVTGLRITVDEVGLKAAKGRIKIKGLVILNPEEFPDRLMFDIPELYVDLNMPTLLRKRLHLQQMRIDIREFTIIRNAKGELNLDYLKTVKTQRGQGGPKDIKGGEAAHIRIDNLLLKIGGVAYKDYSQGPSPVVIESSLNIEEEFRNVQDLHAVVSVIVVEAIRKSALAHLININLEKLAMPVAKTLESARQIAGGAIAVGQTAAKQLTEGIKKTTEGLSHILKTPGDKETAQADKEAAQEQTGTGALPEENQD